MGKFESLITAKEAQRPQGFAISTAVAAPELPARAGALPERLQDIARSYLGARRQSGVSLLEAARWLSEARSEAKHGEWSIFLEAIGLDESRARAQIRIHEEAQRDPIFADRIVNGFLSETVARELLPLPSEQREELLAREAPITREEVREAKRAPAPVLGPPAQPDLADILKRLDAHGYAKSGTRQKGITTFYSFRNYASELAEGDDGVLELAEGELPLWLNELDAKAAYAQARQEKYLAAKDRAEALGYSLTRDGLYFALAIPGNGMPALRGTLDQIERTLTTYEKNAAKQAPAADRPLRQHCPTCGEEIMNGIWGDLKECGVCYRKRPTQPAEPEMTDDSVIIAAIRRQAEELGMQVIWEDDEVILYWHVEDIDGLAPMSYAEALAWLTKAFFERDQKAPDPTLIELDANRMPDALHRAGYYWHSGTPPTIALNGSDRRWSGETIAQAIEVARTHHDSKGEPIAVFPALTPMECKALLREAKAFIASGLDRKLPTIGQALRIAARMALEATED